MSRDAHDCGMGLNIADDNRTSPQSRVVTDHHRPESRRMRPEVHMRPDRHPPRPVSCGTSPDHIAAGQHQTPACLHMT